jgi:alcohol dehydrogenase (cytochrome c)/quinohemoprotein ethanol dehydrogenase
MADDDQTPKKLAANLGIDTSVAELPDNPEVIAAVKEATSGHLAAWDPVQQKEVWRVSYPGAWNGGVLSTKGGLVFQGSASGFFYAFEADTGEKLWEFPTQTGIVAAPISYEVDGEQYISVSAGWGGIFPLITGDLVADAAGDPVNRSRVLTFKIGGKASLPEPTDVPRQLPDFSAQQVNETWERKGFATYDRFCGACHGASGVGGGVVPDLRFSAILGSEDAWKSVVIDGVLSNRGMVGFGDEITAEQAEEIRHYMLKRNRVARELGTTSRLSR